MELAGVIDLDLDNVNRDLRSRIYCRISGASDTANIHRNQQ